MLVHKLIYRLICLTMHKKFDNQAIEKKWQQRWSQSGLYDVLERDSAKEKEYVLVEWPYPSGNLHIGHWYAFAVPDIYVRLRRMKGLQVIFPIGFDAFGLPAENAAIKRDINPREWTEKNIAHMRQQLNSMGNAFSWDKTTSSTDEEYYRWTQWMFTQFFEQDIAYRASGVVNWCSSCQTVIANEQVINNTDCERCGSEVEKKDLSQWYLRITKYADRLVDDLEKIDWPEHIKEAQRQWIGRSEGVELDFKLSSGDTVTVFTTRADTLLGATYMVLAPEHKLVEKHKKEINNWDEVEDYIEVAVKKDEQDRLNDSKNKTGVKLDGLTATNPASGEEIPVYIADYVLVNYGTGAIMAVPAHDERDYDFAKKFNLPIKQVVRRIFGQPLPNSVERVAAGAIVYNPKDDKYLISYSKEFKKYTPWFGGLEAGENYADGAIRETLEESGYKTKFVRYIGGEVESHFYHPGKKVNRSLVSRMCLLELIDDAPNKISEAELAKHEPVWLTAAELKEKLNDEREAADVSMLFDERPFVGMGNLCNSDSFNGLSSEAAKTAITKQVGGHLKKTYRLHDWSVGRQRYWGVPIPIVYDPSGKPHAVPKEHLPWTLPDDVDFKPTGKPPLAKSKTLKDRTEKIFGPGWTPEVETMDTFLDSSWYFLRYLDSHNDTEVVSQEAQESWSPVDLYFGGAEHTTLHLLYSRFWQKVLFDLGVVTHDEPYHRRINRGLILGTDGNKMSKSKGNVIDPDEQVALLGADAVKMYLAFMGPYEGNNYPWDMGGIAGVRRFLERVYGLDSHIAATESADLTKGLHKTIAKVSNDVTQFKFNTAISAMMVFVNRAEKEGLTRESYETFLKILAPFASHLTEELWEKSRSQKEPQSIHQQTFPTHNPDLIRDKTVTIGVQINGKLRGEITLPSVATEAEALAKAKGDAKLTAKITGEINKTIYVPGKILNLIIRR